MKRNVIIIAVVIIILIAAFAGLKNKESGQNSTPEGTTITIQETEKIGSEQATEEEPGNDIGMEIQEEYTEEIDEEGLVGTWIPADQD